MTQLHPYLTFNGNCEEAFEFYKSVFGGEFTFLGRFSEMPESPDYTVSEEDKNKIMHVSLPIDGDYILMGSDAGGDWAPNTVVGNNFSLSLTVASKEEADKLHSQLSEAGTITMPMGDTFWGDYFGMCVDKFGISWMISYNAQQQQEQQHTGKD